MCQALRKTLVIVLDLQCYDFNSITRILMTLVYGGDNDLIVF